MTERTFEFTDAIAAHSRGLAAAATGNLDARVDHCPGWSVRDLVQHVTMVHWFWGTIVDERLSAPPDEARRPAPVPDDELVATFSRGADRLVEVLRAADQRARVWTWAPAQQDVAFVTRHQVQEAAVHHWDAARAAGADITIAAPIAIDSITEFLTFSVSSDADPADPPRPPLDGRFALQCTDAPAGWTLYDGGQPGTVAFQLDAQAGVPTINASASDLLLWLYGRVDVDTSNVPAEIVERFRALRFTD